MMTDWPMKDRSLCSLSPCSSQHKCRELLHSVSFKTFRFEKYNSIIQYGERVIMWCRFYARSFVVS